MKKAKYYYNTSTLRYEPIEKSWKKRLLEIFGFVCATLVFAFAILVLAFQYIESPSEKALKRELGELNLVVETMQGQAEVQKKILGELQDRDDNIYRVIFEAEPIPRTVREAGRGGSNRYKGLEDFSNSDLLTETQGDLDKINRMIYMQSKSYDKIRDMIKNKEEMFASIPAIQPVANKDLKRMASGFGMRIHPIYKTRKMHWGMDFTAPTGTPVYATGNAKVVRVQKLKKGYGYNVKLDHGYNYMTLYAHLSTINVRKGQKVSRGDVIGEVGSTGTSTAPHLHYEVVKVETKNGKKIEKKVNPVYYYYNDLGPEEFEEMIEMSNRANQSFD